MSALVVVPLAHGLLQNDCSTVVAVPLLGDSRDPKREESGAIEVALPLLLPVVEPFNGMSNAKF